MLSTDFTALLRDPIVLSNLISVGTMLTVVGTVFWFSGYFEVFVIRDALISWRALLLCLLLNGLAFGVVIGIGFRRGGQDGLIGAGVGLGLAFSNWFYYLSVRVYRASADTNAALLGRSVVVALLAVFYTIPAILTAVSYGLWLVVLEWCWSAARKVAPYLMGYADRREKRVRLPQDYRRGYWDLKLVARALDIFIWNLPASVWFYVAGTIVALICKPVITLGFDSTIDLRIRLGLLMLVGLEAGSSFMLITQLLKGERRPKISRGEEVLRQYQIGAAHQAFLQNALLVAGFVGAFGLSTVIGTIQGPALGLRAHLIFGMETSIAPAILANISALIGNRLHRYRLTAWGTVLAVLGTSVLGLQFAAGI